MNRWVCVLRTFWFALMTPVYAPVWAGDQPHTMAEDVMAVERRWLANEDRPDVVKSILADDFVHVLPIGFISKDDHLEFVRKHRNIFPRTRCFEELRVRIYGEVAIATGIVYAVGNSDGKPKRTAFTDVFILRAGKWLAVNAQEISPEPGSGSGSKPVGGTCLK